MLFSSESLKCCCNRSFLGQILLHFPTRNAPAVAWFQSNCLCLGGGFGNLSRQHLHDLRPLEFCSARTPEHGDKVEKRRDQLQKHKLLPFTTQGASAPTIHNLKIAVAAVEWLWYGPDKVSVSFDSCKSHRHWSWLDLVRKMMKGQC